MAEFPALPLFTDAFLGDTLHLNAAQIGAYMLMLMTAWRASDCAIHNDDVYLSRICRMDKRTWLANKGVLLAFWHITNDAKLFQKRLKDERKYVDDLKRKNSEAGKASALKRKDRHSTSVSTKPQPNLNPHTLPTPLVKDNTIVLSKKINDDEKKKRASRLPDDWILEQEWGDWAESHGMTGDEIEMEAEKFKDYWHGSGKVKVDWLATWRNWVRSYIERKSNALQSKNKARY